MFPSQHWVVALCPHLACLLVAPAVTSLSQWTLPQIVLPLLLSHAARQGCVCGGAGQSISKESLEGKIEVKLKVMDTHMWKHC